MMTNRALTAVAVSLALASAACSPVPYRGIVRNDPTYEQAARNPFVPANYRAADVLIAQLDGKLSPSLPFIIATIVDIDELDRSSTLGRLVSEHISARFAQAGYRTVELKLRNKIYMASGQGELLLTREIRDIAVSHDAQAVVVGTYGESSNFVFINLKVIRPRDNIALAVHNYALPLDRDVRTLVRASH